MLNLEEVCEGAGKSNIGARLIDAGLGVLVLGVSSGLAYAAYKTTLWLFDKPLYTYLPSAERVWQQAGAITVFGAGLIADGLLVSASLQLAWAGAKGIYSSITKPERYSVTKHRE